MGIVTSIGIGGCTIFRQTLAVAVAGGWWLEKKAPRHIADMAMWYIYAILMGKNHEDPLCFNFNPLGFSIISWCLCWKRHKKNTHKISPKSNSLQCPLTRVIRCYKYHKPWLIGVMFTNLAIANGGYVEKYDIYHLVGGFNLPLWKIYEWWSESHLGWLIIPNWMESHNPAMFQTTNQIGYWLLLWTLLINKINEIYKENLS